MDVAFSDDKRNGFAALAELDSNSDGVVDSSDAEWGNLRVMRWTDANYDGVMQESESSMVTLDSLGIKSLRTGYTESDHVDKSGNEHRQVGSYTKTDGTTAKMTDVWFVTSNGDTTYDDSDIPAHSAAIKALPDLAGMGRLYGLRDAMALDDAEDADGNSRLVAPYYETTRTEKRSLREMVAAFVETGADGDPVLGKAARTALAERILLRWAGAEGDRENFLAVSDFLLMWVIFVLKWRRCPREPSGQFPAGGAMPARCWRASSIAVPDAFPARARGRSNVGCRRRRYFPCCSLVYVGDHSRGLGLLSMGHCPRLLSAHVA